MTKQELKPAIKYRPDIDGLRAVAIISVIIFHFCNLLPSGYIGVDIFFVISGFLITKIILQEHEVGHFSFVNFYARRILRIFPALFLMLSVSFAFAALVLNTKDMIWFSKSLHYSSLQISNFFFQRTVNYFDANEGFEPLVHTWSLAVEEQFYLLMPAIIIFLLSFKKKLRSKNAAFYGIIALSLISLAASQVLVFSNQKIAFYSLVSRFFELGIGCLLAFDKIKISSDKTNSSLSLFGLALIIFSAFALNYSYFPGLLAIVPCLGAALIILTGKTNKTFVAKLLSGRFLVFIGKISYSLYLWHLPLLTLYKKYQGNSDLSLLENLILIAVLITISTLSWKFVELPFRKKYTSFLNRKYDGKIKFQHPFLVAAICILLLATISKISQKTDGFNFRLAKSDLLNATNLDQYAEFGKKCGVGKNSAPFPNIDECVIGQNQKEYEVVVFGDSHAGHYSSAISDLAQKRDLSTMSFYLFLCPPIISDANDSKNQKCQDYRDQIKQILLSKTHIKYVFIAGRWNDISDPVLFKKQITETINFLSSLNKKIIVMGSIPDSRLAGAKTSPLECVENKLTPIQRFLPTKEQNCSSLAITKFDKQFEHEEIIKNAAKKYQNVTYFDPFKYLCDSENCYFVKDGELLYADRDHLNINGSKYIQNFINFE